jgi:hypothetical protein
MSSSSASGPLEIHVPEGSEGLVGGLIGMALTEPALKRNTLRRDARRLEDEAERARSALIQLEALHALIDAIIPLTGAPGG